MSEVSRQYDQQKALPMDGEGLAWMIAAARTRAALRGQSAPPAAKFCSWVEGPRAVAALLDSGIQSYHLTILYWRVYKVGWFRVRVVFGVEGPEPQVRAFVDAFEKWADGET